MKFPEVVGWEVVGVPEKVLEVKQGKAQKEHLYLRKMVDGSEIL